MNFYPASAYNVIEDDMRRWNMRDCRKMRQTVGVLALTFGAGILLAFLLPGKILAFIEAAVLLCAGFMLIK